MRRDELTDWGGAFMATLAVVIFGVAVIAGLLRLIF